MSKIFFVLCVGCMLLLYVSLRWYVYGFGMYIWFGSSSVLKNMYNLGQVRLSVAYFTQFWRIFDGSNKKVVGPTL